MSRLISARSVLAALAACAALSLLASCTNAAGTGFRDQAISSVQRGAERGERGRSHALSRDSVRLEEFLGAYRFDLPPTPGAAVGAHLLIGGRGTDREHGEGWLMLALDAPRTPEAALPPRRWAIALDVSHSMGDGGRWQLAVDAATRLVARLRPEDRVSLLLFGSQVESVERWAPPDAVARRLGDLARAPHFSNDGQRPGLVALGRLLLEPDAGGTPASGYFITDMDGAPADLPSSMRALADAGANVNVVGLAGGNETLLRDTAREASGSYVFLDDAAAIERDFGARSSETFDVSVRDVRVALWCKDGADLAAQDADGGIDEGARAGEAGERLLVPLTGGRLGPGGTWVGLWRLARVREGTAAEVIAYVTGRDAAGREFSLAVHPAAGYLAPSVRTPESAALLKAVTIAHEVAALRSALAGGYAYGARSFADSIARVRAMAEELRDAQKTLHDPEFARDLEALDAAARLTEAQVAAWREDRRAWRCGTCSLPGFVGRVVALPFVILLTLFGGG